MRASPAPEVVDKLERLLSKGKENGTDPDLLATKVTLKAIELLSIPQCGGNPNKNNFISVTKSCFEKAFDVALNEAITIIHKGEFDPKLLATKIALRVSSVLLKASCSRLSKCATRRNRNNGNNTIGTIENEEVNNTRRIKNKTD
uniref:Uncharacterized protein n=1 Tax=viral metagenome TaxID=1070528 RepID=A0A6C0JXW5_9ZZZZ